MDLDLTFIKNEQYPEPDEAFNFKPLKIEEIKDDCLYLLDANVLLLPFSSDSKSLKAIEKVYKKLASENRLFIPAHAAREYLSHRAQKIGDIYQSVTQKRDSSFNPLGAYPLLSELSSYSEMRELESSIKDLYKKYSEQLRKIASTIESWVWDDPISEMYQRTFKNRILSDSELDRKSIKKDLERRIFYSLPPGYKDKTKTENTAGDLMIWQEILTLGKKENKHIIFVSGDEKPDWWYQSNKKNIYPRFELVNEYRKETNGKTFHIASLSKLLKTFDTDADIVQAIRQTEDLEQSVKNSNIKVNLEKLILLNTLLKTMLTLEYTSTNGLSRSPVMRMSEDENGEIFYKKIYPIHDQATQQLIQHYKTIRQEITSITAELSSWLPNKHNKRNHLSFNQIELPHEIDEAQKEIEDLINLSLSHI